MHRAVSRPRAGGDRPHLLRRRARSGARRSLRRPAATPRTTDAARPTMPAIRAGRRRHRRRSSPPRTTTCSISPNNRPQRSPACCSAAWAPCCRSLRPLRRGRAAGGHPRRAARIVQEPAVTLRVNPLHPPPSLREIERLDPDLADAPADRADRRHPARRRPHRLAQRRRHARHGRTVGTGARRCCRTAPHRIRPHGWRPPTSASHDNSTTSTRIARRHAGPTMHHRTLDIKELNMPMKWN